MQQVPWQPVAEGVITGEYAKDLPLIRQAAHAGDSEDVVIREFHLLGHPAALICVDGLADAAALQRFLLFPLLSARPPEGPISLADYLCQGVLPLVSLTATARLSTVLSRLFSGDAVLICDTMEGALIADTKGFVRRAVNQPVNESVVVGPHEGFNESLRDNVVLIRRLLRTPALISESMTVGQQVPARLCLLYLEGVARKDTVAELRRRIQGCRVDYVSSIGMLEQLIEDRPFSLLPQAVATERPDRAVSFLNEGQIVIVMENASTVLALPMNLLHLYHAPDDTALRWQYGTFLRLLRLVGMAVSLLLPALFICLTVFHPEGMSLSLLTSVMESQARVPFSLLTSTLLMLLIFSLINEAGARVPGAMGSSLSIVGGLILGQAAVEADLFSPLVIIVVALSGLGSYAVPVFSLTLSLRLAQLFLLILSGLAGYLGLALGVLTLLLHAASLTSLGEPFLSPMAPKRVSNPDKILRLPIWRQRLRGALADPMRGLRVRGAMRAWDQSKGKP